MASNVHGLFLLEQTHAEYSHVVQGREKMQGSIWQIGVEWFEMMGSDESNKRRMHLRDKPGVTATYPNLTRFYLYIPTTSCCH